VTKKQGKTLADLRAMHDRKVVVPNRIREALAILAKNGDDWAYEADFQALVKPPIANMDIAKYRDGFQDFWAELPERSSGGRSRQRRVWFVSKKLASEWKENAIG
jgi:hypothetical protein